MSQNHKKIRPIGKPAWETGSWLFHQVVVYGGNIYSACEKLNETAPMYVVNLDKSMYKSLLFDSGNWAELAPFTITDFD